MKISDTQSKAYIFTLVEPNCSIIAACLLCYGTLVRALGGRNLESVVRSVRSALSLRSRQSSNGSDSRSRSQAIRLDSQKGRSDSQVELTELERASHIGIDEAGKVPGQVIGERAE
jgi:hypothetical protein